MVKQKRIYLPAGFGGLIRYHEEEKQAIKLKPWHVIAIVVGMVTLQFLLRLIG